MNNNTENDKVEKDLTDNFGAAEKCCADDVESEPTKSIQDVYNDLLVEHGNLEQQYSFLLDGHKELIDKLDALAEEKDIRKEYLRKAYELLNEIDSRKRALNSDDKNFIRELGKLVG